MIVDTTFVIDLLRGDRPALDLLAELERGSSALRVPSVVFQELTDAWARSRVPARDFDRVMEILAAQDVVVAAPAHARRAGRLAADLARDGEPIDPLAAQVAGACLVEDEALVTRDVRTYGRVPGLRIVQY